jgi:hypothetical protein
VDGKNHHPARVFRVRFLSKWSEPDGFGGLVIEDLFDL